MMLDLFVLIKDRHRTDWYYHPQTERKFLVSSFDKSQKTL